MSCNGVPTGGRTDSFLGFSREQCGRWFQESLPANLPDGAKDGAALQYLSTQCIVNYEEDSLIGDQFARKEEETYGEQQTNSDVYNDAQNNNDIYTDAQINQGQSSNDVYNEAQTNEAQNNNDIYNDDQTNQEQIYNDGQTNQVQSSDNINTSSGDHNGAQTNQAQTGNNVPQNSNEEYNGEIQVTNTNPYRK